MTPKKIKAVEEEMKRLKQQIEELKNDRFYIYPHEGDKKGIWNPKVTGAIKRASMDLTRALADLRRSDYQ